MDDGKLCVLAIGNSFSADAVENYLYDLFNEAGIEAVIGNMFIGGCTLEKHWENVRDNKATYEYRKIQSGKKTVSKKISLENVINDEKWDIITFQQASGISGIYTTYDPYLRNLINWAQNNSDAQLLFHQTWAYSQDSTHPEYPNYENNQMVMYDAIIDAVKNAMQDHTELVDLIPCATAIQNCRTSFLGDTFTRDGYHLETSYGRFTAACTWFEALTGLDVRDNPYCPANITTEVKETVHRGVHAAISNPYEITEIKSDIYPSEIFFLIENPVLCLGETLQLEINILPEDTTEKTVTWQSADEGVVTVSENGLATAISAGSVIITASCGDVSAECTITVLADAGVESFLANPESKISIYSLEGILIKNECKVEDLKTLNKGIYIIVAGRDRYKISI